MSTTPHQPESPTTSAAETRSSRIQSQPPTTDEIVKAIQSMENNRAAGIDQITTELLKACLITSANIF